MTITRYLLTSLLILLLTVPPALADTEVHVFELENRRAQSLIPQLQSLYGGDDVVFSPDGQRLMVRATPEQLAEIDQLLRHIDVAARQLRITVRESSGGEASSQNRQNRTRSTGSQRTQTLTVEDGQIASIRSGRISALPVAVQGGDNPAAILEKVDQTSGFLVEASVLSEEMVELRITAMRNDPVVGMPGHETAAVVTMRRASTGEWVNLGQETREQQARSGSRVISSQAASSDNRSWDIKVDVLP